MFCFFLVFLNMALAQNTHKEPIRRTQLNLAEDLIQHTDRFRRLLHFKSPCDSSYSHTEFKRLKEALKLLISVWAQMSLRDIACDVGECKRNTSQTHTMVKFENTFSTKLKKNHKNQDKPLEEDGGCRPWWYERIHLLVSELTDSWIRSHHHLLAEGFILFKAINRK